MKNLLIGAALCLAACSSPEPAAPDNGALAIEQPAAPGKPTVDPAAIDAAKAALLGEPAVKDIRYSPDDTVQWHVGVLDDGSSRVGYAEYVCSVLAENGATSGRTHVRIVDVAKVGSGADFRSASLGHVICETGDIVAP